MHDCIWCILGNLEEKVGGRYDHMTLYSNIKIKIYKIIKINRYINIKQ